MIKEILPSTTYNQYYGSLYLEDLKYIYDVIKSCEFTDLSFSAVSLKDNLEYDDFEEMLTNVKSDSIDTLCIFNKDFFEDNGISIDINKESIRLEYCSHDMRVKGAGELLKSHLKKLKTYSPIRGLFFIQLGATFAIIIIALLSKFNFFASTLTKTISDDILLPIVSILYIRTLLLPTHKLFGYKIKMFLYPKSDKPETYLCQLFKEIKKTSTVISFLIAIFAAAIGGAVGYLLGKS